MALYIIDILEILLHFLDYDSGINFTIINKNIYECLKKLKWKKYILEVWRQKKYPLISAIKINSLFYIYNSIEGNENEKDNEGTTALYIAVEKGNLNVALILLNNGSDVDCECKGDSPLHKAAENNDFDMCELLLKYNANINKQNCMGETPIHISVSLQNWDITYLLLRYQADLLIYDNNNKLPVNYDDSNIIMSYFLL